MALPSPKTVLIIYRYFIHNEFAGISTFINEPAPESERNASMLSVGVLLRLDNGRMGKSWLHTEGLQNLARYGLASTWPELGSKCVAWKEAVVGSEAGVMTQEESPLTSPGSRSGT